MPNYYKAPFPWFGGKARVADVVWKAFGDVPNYVEPFAGSLAVLLNRPHPPQTETINDIDGLLSNFWRSVVYSPETVAQYADRPVNENDLHAIHAWLIERMGDLPAKLEGDPQYYDAQIAGWWVWGICSWIGSGWCSGNGPWIVQDGNLINRRKLPHLGDKGRGIKRQRPNLSNKGQGINRQLPHLGDKGQGILGMMMTLHDRIRSVRVCCGDFERVVTPNVTSRIGITGVFLDPPYSNDDNIAGHDMYRSFEDDVADRAYRYAVANGDNPKLRIAFCSYEGNFEFPDNWTKHKWKAREGYQASDKGNSSRERIWFSPHCLPLQRPGLFSNRSA